MHMHMHARHRCLLGALNIVCEGTLEAYQRADFLDSANHVLDECSVTFTADHNDNCLNLHSASPLEAERCADGVNLSHINIHLLSWPETHNKHSLRYPSAAGALPTRTHGSARTHGAGAIGTRSRGSTSALCADRDQWARAVCPGIDAYSAARTALQGWNRPTPGQRFVIHESSDGTGPICSAVIYSSQRAWDIFQR